MLSCPFQAYNLSRDHKPDLEVERERILKAGGFIHAGRVNGSLNLARAIGDMTSNVPHALFSFLQLLIEIEVSSCLMTPQTRAWTF